MYHPVIVVHGGAWDIPEERLEASLGGVKEAARAGFRQLHEEKTCVDAVIEAVSTLENDPNFDAGRGSCLNVNGVVEMHAMVMRGEDLNCGGVIAVKNIKNPVKLARVVMEKTNHCMLNSVGCETLAKKYGIEEKNLEYFVTEECRKELEHVQRKYPNTISTFFNNDSGHDTVGAVALDKYGNIASATSTGGITAQMVGRVSDSPVPGAGGYADNNSAAVSTTGHGEAILKTSLARLITFYHEQGKDLQLSVKDSLNKMIKDVDGYGGAIAVNREGKVGVHFSTTKMPWAVIGGKPSIVDSHNNTENNLLYSGILPQQILSESFYL